MSRYHDSRFLPGTFEIHWLSIINSFVLVLLLTAFLTIIMMRVLKNDFSRYMEVEEDEIGEEETGWKLINGDVFRFPPFANGLTALLGAGAHLLCVTLLLLICAISNCIVPTKRGAILTAMIILYAWTMLVAHATTMCIVHASYDHGTCIFYEHSTYMDYYDDRACT